MGDNNPLISAVLSFFIPGLGQALICKKARKGAIIFVASVVIYVMMLIFAVFTFGLSMLVSFAWWLAQLYDAYMDAQGKPVLKI